MIRQRGRQSVIDPAVPQGLPQGRRKAAGQPEVRGTGSPARLLQRTIRAGQTQGQQSRAGRTGAEGLEDAFCQCVCAAVPQGRTDAPDHARQV